MGITATFFGQIKDALFASGYRAGAGTASGVASIFSNRTVGSFDFASVSTSNKLELTNRSNVYSDELESGSYTATHFVVQDEGVLFTAQLMNPVTVIAGQLMKFAIYNQTYQRGIKISIEAPQLT